MLDLRQTPEYAKYMTYIGWVVEKKGNTYYYIKKIPLLGSVLKIQRPLNISYQYINVLVVKYRVFQVIIEPKNTNQISRITYYGYKQSKSPSLPSKTIHIDLTKSEKQLLNEMHYKTRYNIKLGKRSKVKVKNSKDIERFTQFWQDCALKQRGMFLPMKKEIKSIYNIFNKNTDLIFVLHSNELIAGILLLHSNNISYYMYAASNADGKKLYAPTICAWEAIKLARKRGSKIFDFEGIYDERFPLKSWKGFTRFKKSFGGHEVEYPGAFVKFRFPI